MDAFMNFLANNYIILIIITLFLVFALVGFFVEAKNGEETPFKIKTAKSPEIKLEDIQITNNVSLQEMVNGNANVKQNTEDQNQTSQNNSQML